MGYQPSYQYIPPIKWAVLTPIYDLFCTITGFGKKFRKKVLRAATLQGNEVAIDIGCGTGVFLRFAKTMYRNLHLIGVDPDTLALSIAKRRFAEAGLQIELKQGFAESLPIPDASIDICFSTLVFHHLPDDIKKRTIQEIYRVLKHGGKVVIADFGKRTGIIVRLYAIIFEKLEYIRGNLKGVIPQYLEEIGFKNTTIAEKHFLAIDIIVAWK